MIEMQLDNLPRWSGKYEGKICWRNTPGCKVKFKCDELTGVFLIKSYDDKQRKVCIQYLGKDYWVKVKHFIGGHVSNIINNHTKDYKVEIGTHFTDYNRDLIIIDRKMIENLV